MTMIKQPLPKVMIKTATIISPIEKLIKELITRTPWIAAHVSLASFLAEVSALSKGTRPRIMDSLDTAAKGPMLNICRSQYQMSMTGICNDCINNSINLHGLSLKLIQNNLEHPGQERYPSLKVHD